MLDLRLLVFSFLMAVVLCGCSGCYGTRKFDVTLYSGGEEIGAWEGVTDVSAYTTGCISFTCDGTKYHVYGDAVLQEV